MIRSMLNTIPLAGQSSGGSIDSSGSLLSLFQNLNSIGGGLGGAFSGAGAGAGSVVIYPGQGSSAYTGYNGYSGYTGYSSATVSPGGSPVLLSSCPHWAQHFITFFLLQDPTSSRNTASSSLWSYSLRVITARQGIISTIFNSKDHFEIEFFC